MSEHLQELLSRIADDARPGSPDPDLWARARRAKRRGEQLVATTVVLSVIALVAGIAFSVRALEDDSSPARPPHEIDRVPGIPSSVHGIDGTGGLPLERDLAVGQASVAFGNAAGAFVVSAADGSYHRLALPGYDAAMVARSSAMLALSPDGDKLAYSWHKRVGPDAVPGEGENYYLPSGVRVVDLRTGEIWDDTPQDSGTFFSRYVGLAMYDMRWSSDSRYLGYGRCLNINNFAGDACSEGHETEVLDTRNGRLWNVRVPVPPSRGEVPTGAPLVSASGDGAVVVGTRLVTLQRSRVTGRIPLDATAPWIDGLVVPDERQVLLQASEPSGSLLSVDLDSGASEQISVLDAAGRPHGARIELLGWVGGTQVLAALREGTGSGYRGDAELALLDLSSAPVTVTRVGELTDTGASEFTFATGLATVDFPTRSFEASPAGEVPSTPGASSDDGGAPVVLLAGGAAGVLAGGLALVVLRRRRRLA
jgi:hypothetical protein